MTAVGAGVATALAPALLLPTNEFAPTIRFLPPAPRTRPDPNLWMWELLMENIQHAPPLRGTLNISLHTSNPNQ